MFDHATTTYQNQKHPTLRLVYMTSRDALNVGGNGGDAKKDWKESSTHDWIGNISLYLRRAYIALRGL